MGSEDEQFVQHTEYYVCGLVEMLIAQDLSSITLIWTAGSRLLESTYLNGSKAKISPVTFC